MKNSHANVRAKAEEVDHDGAEQSSESTTGNGSEWIGVLVFVVRNTLMSLFVTKLLAQFPGDGDGTDDSNEDSVVTQTFLIRKQSEEDRDRLVTAFRFANGCATWRDTLSSVIVRFRRKLALKSLKQIERKGSW